MQLHFLRRAAGVAGAALFALSLTACDLAMSGFHEEAKDNWSKSYPLAANGRLEIVNTNGSIRVVAADSPQVEIQAERIARSATQQGAKDSWSKSYPLAANGRLEIVNTNGSIHVVAADSPQVEIRAERVARSATQQGAKDLLAKLEMKEDVSSDRIHIESKQPLMVGLHGGIEVRYTVTVPRNAVVDLRETNGSIDASGLTQESHFSTTNGHIDGRTLNGAVHASSTNGHVELQMASLSQDVDAETTNGHIVVRVPSDAGAEVSARVTNGHIGIEGLPSLKADDENSRRRFSGRLNGGGHALRLQTTNGSITLTSNGVGGDKEKDKAKNKTAKGDKDALER